MPAVIEEISSRLEGISDKTYCHLYPQYGSAPRAHCGVPRGEQQPHSVNGSQEATICATCGLPRCPICRHRQWKKDD